MLFYNAQSRNWMPAGQGPARVELYRDPARSTYRVVARTLADHAVRPEPGAAQTHVLPVCKQSEDAQSLTGRPRTSRRPCRPSCAQVVINSQLYPNLEYRRAKETFHQWQDARYVYGLHFASKEEATMFGTGMDKALQSVNAAAAKEGDVRACKHSATSERAQPVA